MHPVGEAGMHLRNCKQEILAESPESRLIGCSSIDLCGPCSLFVNKRCFYGVLVGNR